MRSKLRHPIRAIREPFGTAGLIVACIALIAALGGSAIAAKGALTGKQKKEVEKIAKKYAGKPGATGATGPAGSAGAPGAPGAKGDAGAAGANGTNGTNGTNGVSPTGTAFSGAKGGCTEGGVEFKGANTTFACNGVKGTTGFTDTLPPGKTETGFFAASNESGERTHYEPISFNIPLSTAPEPNFINEKGEAEIGNVANCPGEAADPAAKPGQLCLFSMGEEGVPIPPNPNQKVQFPVLLGSGGLIFITFLAKGSMVGSWAVTGPTSP